ncbi:MAG TPA: folylpolyglutamate synthase/dihydrofolate synthase family protein [Terriglobales bacterium]|nr:folylpolyglutamate synthase/dihydrofolate synthase family protein [Terriglobales bacterium]
MAVSYHQAVADLLSLGHELTSQRKFDLDHMRVLAAAMGNPQRRLPSVLIAGTNGKGSTAATLAGIVEAAGYRTGLYTSPHLIRINERIQINHEPISDSELALIYERVDSAARELVSHSQLPWHPSFFEMLTAMMFEYFASAGVELAVLEVGMGGRLDATNIADPAISVIADIDFDHQKFLGDTLPEIAHEKAGIIRQSGTVVLLPQHPLVNDVLGREIMERNAKPISAVKNMPSLTPIAGPYSKDEYPLEIMGETVEIASPLAGRHQLRNVALAITAAEELNHFGFRISPGQIAEGVRNTRWPGRFEVIHSGLNEPEYVLDVAHNPAGAWALRSTLSAVYPERPLTLVFGAMRDKAIGEIAEILFPLAETVIVTHADSPRAATAQEIMNLAQHTQATMVPQPNIAVALEAARASAGKDGVIVVTGSIYVVGAAMAILVPAFQGA